MCIRLRKTVVLQPDAIPDDRTAVVRFAAVRRGVPRAAVLPGENNMERVTLRIPKQQIEEVEQMVETGEYPNRSEAIRSAVREMINERDGEHEPRRNRNWAKV